MFNVLGKLQSEILTGEKRQAVFTLTLYSRLLRQACDFSTRESVPFHEEKLFLENYLKLEKERFGETPFNFLFENFDKQTEFVVPFILQPFVELALLSGLGTPNLIIKISFNNADHSIKIESIMKNPEAAYKLSEKCEIAQDRLKHFRFSYQTFQIDSIFLQVIHLSK